MTNHVMVKKQEILVRYLSFCGTNFALRAKPLLILLMIRSTFYGALRCFQGLALFSNRDWSILRNIEFQIFNTIEGIHRYTNLMIFHFLERDKYWQHLYIYIRIYVSYVSLTILLWCNITHKIYCRILPIFEIILVLFCHVLGSRPLEVQTNQISQPSNSFPDIDGVRVYCCIGIWVYLDSSILIESNATLDITRHHNKTQKK